MHKNLTKILVSEEQINKRIGELADQINKEFDGQRIVLVGLLHGSIPFLWELMKRITVDTEIDTMDVSSYRGTQSTGEVKIVKDLTRGIKDHNVILVEDIVDTGQTLNTVYGLLKNRNPKVLKVITLLDKPEGRVVEFKPDYIGFEVPNEFVVGFGLDYDELYRNLPYVGVLKEECYM